MRIVGSDPNGFRAPFGFVDTLALLTLASAVGITLVTIVNGIWLL
jgi:hypothetical protein